MRIPKHVPWRSTGTTLGSGGQGEVHLVTHRCQPQGPKYALKILRNAQSPQALLRFRREIEAIKNLTSASIAKVIDHSGVDEPFQFYVMEYHEGAETLDSVIFSDSNPYYGNASMSLDLFEQMISAIKDCQVSSPPIVHRDINPKNILVLQDKTIRIIDFGICQFQDGTIITLADENVGTRNYSSPESESGNDANIGVHSDIYSASKVLWSAITSRRAFAREEAVFGDLSMEKMFPTKSLTWHLSHIFENTIRQNPSDRVSGVGETFAVIHEVRYLIDRGFPPLREIPSRCPSCGMRGVGQYREGFKVFGNPNPVGVESVLCSSCGFVFLRDNNVWRKNVERLEGLS